MGGSSAVLAQAPAAHPLDAALPPLGVQLLLGHGIFEEHAERARLVQGGVVQGRVVQGGVVGGGWLQIASAGGSERKNHRVPDLWRFPRWTSMKIIPEEGPEGYPRPVA